MSKSQILIPFDTATGNMVVYPDGDRDVWYDKEAKRKHWYTPHSHPPRETVSQQRERVDHGYRFTTSTWVSVPNPNYAQELVEWKAKCDEWDRRLESGEIVVMPNVTWRENHVFEATLEVTGIIRGRSAARFRLRDTADHTRRYEMFMTGVEDLLINGEISKGKIPGRWTYCKRGKNYALKPFFEKPRKMKEETEETKGCGDHYPSFRQAPTPQRRSEVQEMVP